mmetsp:Transcript_4078/g.7286  ORF Transcript_4078/g.7286 Transcript_4078/m.7286 type:complete len:293 (+) Transcript_4078:479-1357(+)
MAFLGLPDAKFHLDIFHGIRLPSTSVDLCSFDAHFFRYVSVHFHVLINLDVPKPLPWIKELELACVAHGLATYELFLSVLLVLICNGLATRQAHFLRSQSALNFGEAEFDLLALGQERIAIFTGDTFPVNKNFAVWGNILLIRLDPAVTLHLKISSHFASVPRISIKCEVLWQLLRPSAFFASAFAFEFALGLAKCWSLGLAKCWSLGIWHEHPLTSRFRLAWSPRLFSREASSNLGPASAAGFRRCRQRLLGYRGLERLLHSGLGLLDSLDYHGFHCRAQWATQIKISRLE